MADRRVDGPAGGVHAPRARALRRPGHDPYVLDAGADGPLLAPRRGARRLPARPRDRTRRRELGVPAAVRRRALDPAPRRRRAHARAQLLQGPFHGERMRAFGPVVADLARRELGHVERPGHGARADATPTLEIILRVVLGTRGDRETAELRAAVDGTLGRVRSMPRMLAMALVERDLGPRSPWGRFRIAVERFDALLLDVIARARPGPARRLDACPAPRPARRRRRAAVGPAFARRARRASPCRRP